MMKKSLLALAVAALSANAFALDLGSDAALKYASEIKFATDGTALTLPETVDVETGFSIGIGNVRYVRFDITGAEFDVDNVAAGDLDNANVTTAVSAVDTEDKKYVIFEITAGAALDIDAVLEFTPSILAKSASNVSLQYRLYETGVAALAGSDAVLASKSGSVISYAKALSLAVTSVNEELDKIDVAQESKFFDGATGDTETTLGNVDVQVDDTVLWTGGVATTIADLVSDTASENAIVITGDFSSAADVTLGGVPIDPADLTATTATFPLASAAAVEAVGDVIDDLGKVVYVTNGTDTIAQSDFTATLDLTAATNSTAADLSGDLDSLEKNGASELVNFNLKPKSEGGAYDNYLRISNTSNLAGKFYITVIADDGSNVSLALSDVEGQPATLDARASTTQLRIDDIYAAAVAKGFALAGQGKIRLLVEGEVPSLDVQSYTTSKDGNSFNTF
ncbi:hypothetical protein [Azotobacter armeniacus]